MLWVMTQNKKNIINVKEIRVRDYSTYTKIEGIVNKGFLCTWSRVLGTYPSKERAFEVLTDMHNTIEDNTKYTVTYSMPEN